MENSPLFMPYPMERLLDVLRIELGLTGTKEGCGEGECGACSVLMDGSLVDSCLIPVLQAAGTTIVTIEGLASEGRLQNLQQAFLECGGAQCGICTPGMILAALHLLAKNPQPYSGRDSRRAVGQSLPLHRLPANFGGRCRSRAPECCNVRSDPAEYELVAPRTLPAVLSLLAEHPGAWLPIAGGTDVMVQYSAGQLPRESS